MTCVYTAGGGKGKNEQNTCERVFYSLGAQIQVSLMLGRIKRRKKANQSTSYTQRPPLPHEVYGVLELDGAVAEVAEALEDLPLEHGRRGLARARVAEEETVQGHLQRLLAVQLALVVDLARLHQLPDLQSPSKENKDGGREKSDEWHQDNTKL